MQLIKNMLHSTFSGDKNSEILTVIRNELRREPNFFLPYGAIDKKRIKKVFSSFDFSFPQELINFWCAYGGGEMWQQYYILYPLSDSEIWHEAMIEYNRSEYIKGFDTEYWIFATDLTDYIAFNKKTHDIKEFEYQNKNHIEKAVYKNIKEWFDFMWQQKHNRATVYL